MKIAVIGDGGWGTANAHDKRYLDTKREKMGHLF